MREYINILGLNDIGQKFLIYILISNTNNPIQKCHPQSIWLMRKVLNYNGERIF